MNNYVFLQVAIATALTSLLLAYHGRQFIQEV